MCKAVFYSIILIMLAGCSEAEKVKNVLPGEIWLDADGKPINAHGGGVLFDRGTYYWYGEVKKGPTRRVDYITDWECYRVDAGGVACYSSKDLLNWKNEGLVLPAVREDRNHDLHISKVIERPKVVYNQKTQHYVMWTHVDSEDYSFARAGVAVSESPTGPFKYLGSVRPNGQMSRDMTLFVDDDGSAYHIYSSEENATLHVSLLNDDYLTHSGTYKRIFVGESREAPAVVKHEDYYYLVTSGCTGWAPNEALYAVSDSMLGEWKMIGNPCVGDGSDTTFDAQGAYLLPVDGKGGRFVFMADRWNKTDLESSRYIWLPVKFTDGRMEITWRDQWSPLSP